VSPRGSVIVIVPLLDVPIDSVFEWLIVKFVLAQGSITLSFLLQENNRRINTVKQADRSSLMFIAL
jgi:hypothetical protein